MFTKWSGMSNIGEWRNYVIEPYYILIYCFVSALHNCYMFAMIKSQ